MKDTVIINIVGSPCSGKSTLSSKIFYLMKSKHMDVEHITEFAKDLVWQERFEELDNQYYVACEQYKLLKNVYGKVDYIVCDSPLFMGLFYNYYNKDNVSNVIKTSEMILNRMEEFKNNIYIFIERDTSLPYLDNGRIHNENESEEIQKQIELLLKDCCITYTKVKTCDDINKVLANFFIEFRNYMDNVLFFVIPVVFLFFI